MSKIAKISIVGAGPGDPDLITLKGIKALSTAKVVLYDALVSKELLIQAPQALHIFVGKRANKKSVSQENINSMLVEYALNYGHVVRLKGGDPFVFGRGYEELSYAQNFNIPVEIIPGLSSAIALPALQQVPLTSRGVSRSFWVLTATAHDSQLSQDLCIAAQSSATLVILMGMYKLEEIVNLLICNGKSHTHIMIIQNGSTKDEKVFVSTTDRILDICKGEKLSAPGIIVCGEVVGLHPQLVKQQVNSLIYE